VAFLFNPRSACAPLLRGNVGHDTRDVFAATPPGGLAWGRVSRLSLKNRERYTAEAKTSAKEKIDILQESHAAFLHMVKFSRRPRVDLNSRSKIEFEK
jgi:hypothetical protein